MFYKGFFAVGIYDRESHTIRGKVINTQDIITFYSPVDEDWRVNFRKNFETVIDEYLEFSQELDGIPASMLILTDPQVEQNALDFAERFIDS